VLKAFLDDSGTHDHSDVIVMAGVIASEGAWSILEPQWQRLIEKYEIPKGLHMSKCSNRRGDFRGWSDTKRRRAVTEFRRLIIETGGRLIGSAVARTDWNAACKKSKLGEVFAAPEDFLQSAVLRKALQSKRASTKGHEEISVTFDCREQSLVRWDWMSKGYVKRWPNRFAGYIFGRTEKVLPLQAADMIAYEALVFQCDRLRAGAEPKPRPNLKRLLDTMASDLAYHCGATIRVRTARQ
jgi:hypothetical protein